MFDILCSMFSLSIESQPKKFNQYERWYWREKRGGVKIKTGMEKRISIVHITCRMWRDCCPPWWAGSARGAAPGEACPPAAAGSRRTPWPDTQTQPAVWTGKWPCETGIFFLSPAFQGMGTLSIKLWNLANVSFWIDEIHSLIYRTVRNSNILSQS